MRSANLSTEELCLEVQRAAQAVALWRDSGDARELPAVLLGKTPAQVGEAFQRVWPRVAILPPDQYAAAVVQMTQGCAYNRCRFCSFYKDVPYRVQSAAEFDIHLNAVESFFEAELSERRGFFLAAANAANADCDVLSRRLELLERQADNHSGWSKCWSGGVASFLDTFSQNERSLEQWRSLRDLGLKSLYLGIETGSVPLRRSWRKPGKPSEIIALAEKLKRAGMRLGVIVLSGADSDFIENAHNAATAQLLNQLPLDERDNIYISEYQPTNVWKDDAEYVEYRSACRRCTEELRAGLRFAAYPQGPVVSLYDVWQFLYI
ncbi:radical SAM protein [bacterium]|nr:radical SAM protein [bacterium]